MRLDVLLATVMMMAMTVAIFVHMSNAYEHDSLIRDALADERQLLLRAVSRQLARDREQSQKDLDKISHMLVHESNKHTEEDWQAIVNLGKDHGVKVERQINKIRL